MWFNFYFGLRDEEEEEVEAAGVSLSEVYALSM